MITFNGTDYTLIFSGLLLLAVFFVAQLFFCLRARNTVWLLLPSGLLVLTLIGDIMIYAGLFGTGSGFMQANVIVALLIAILLLFAFGGTVLAWIGYFIYSRVKR